MIMQRLVSWQVIPQHVLSHFMVGPGRPAPRFVWPCIFKLVDWSPQRTAKAIEAPLPARRLQKSRSPGRASTMAGKSQADFRAMLMSKKSDAAAFPVSNGRPTAVLGDGRPTADSVRAMAADAAPKKIPGGAKTYEEAMAEAGGDAAKITGLVMPKPSSRPKQDGPSAASGYGRHAESGGGRRERNKDSNRTVELGEQKKAKKEAKRKDVDEFELVCPKEETIVRIETWVREFEASKSGGDVRCTRTMDMLHLSQFRPGFEMTDSAQGLQWKLKLTVVESGLFTSNEVRLQPGAFVARPPVRLPPPSFS